MLTIVLISGNLVGLFRMRLTANGVTRCPFFPQEICYPATVPSKR